MVFVIFVYNNVSKVLKSLHYSFFGGQMTTYKEIQEYVKMKHLVSVKTCWINHVKKTGIKLRTTPNRLSSTERVNSCSDKYVQLIMDAFNYLGVSK